MAGSKIKGINIKIGADTTGLDSALKKVEDSGKSTRSELAEINRSLKTNNDSVLLWTQKQELLTKAIEKSKEKTNLLEQAQKGIEQAFRDGDIDRQAYDKFHSKLDKAKEKVKSLKEQQEDFKNKLDSGEIGKETYDKFIEKVQKAEREVQGLENSQRSMEENLRLKTVSEEQYRAFQREIDNSRHQTERFENQLKEATNRADELGNEMQESGNQAENAANGGYTVLGNVFANVITEGIKLAGTALKNFTLDVVATGMEYESAISNVVAISGAMAEEVEMLQAKAEEMGATTKFTAAESADAMGYMAMAGWKVNDMISGLDGIMDLSAASGESLASVSDIVTDALTAFGLSAGDSAHFADVLAAASSNANTNVAMMGETFKYAAPVAGALSFTIEDTAEAIGLMANSGIKASQAGTSLRTILTQMSGDIELTGEKLCDYVVHTSNADGSMRELDDILADVRVGWSELSESEQAANAEAIVGKNAMSGFLALMNAAPADIDKLSTAIENADGTAKKMSETMLDNLEGDRTLFSSAFDGVKIAISKELNPALRDLTQYATSQMPKIQAVIEPVFDFVTKAIKAVPKVVDGLEKISPVLTGFGHALLNITALSLMPKITTFCTTTIPTVILPAIKGLFATISAHPFVAVAVALSALTAGVMSYLNAQLDVKTEGELLIEQHNEEIRVLQNKRQAIEDLNNAFYENVDGIQNQTDRTKDLWTELDKLADQYGNVQQKDKARAEYILNELNDALGTEYTMTGNQIDGYKQLSAEIDNVIAKKQAEMLIDSYLANSTEMTKQRIEARTDYEKYDKEYQEKKKALEKAERQYRIHVEDNLTSNPTVEDYLAANFTDGDFQTIEGLKLANAVITAREELQQADNARSVAKRTYEETSKYFENLDQLQEAYSLGQYDRMADIVYAEKDLTSTTLDESATDAEQRLQIYSENLQKTLSDFELAVKDMKQTSVDELEKSFSNLMQSGAVAGVNTLETWEKFKPKILEFQANGLDISPLITPLIDSGIRPAQAFDDWQEVFRTQMKNGGDMTSMLQWLNNSDYTASIPLVFGNNGDFLKYIQEQAAQGQDVEYLLELGAKSGLAELEEFVKIFKSNVSKNLANNWYVGNLLELGNQMGIDLGEEFGESFGTQMGILHEKGVDLTEFIKWAETNGKSVGDVFGENFQAELSEYLKSNTLTNFRNFTENDSTFNFFYGKKTLSERLIKQFADGKDISELVKKAEKQGLKVGDVFGDNYTDVIQQQIDNGYSITELLEWGETSGIETGTMLGRNYTTEVQGFVDDGFLITELLEWAKDAGFEVGNIFGQNFQSVADSYMRSVEIERVSENTGNIVGGQIGNIFSNLPFMADGGFLSHGQAIVAEAGPELLEVMNGGVRVTPLTRTSQNTPVSEKPQQIFYSNYTINATIANGYDVSRLAEELETERRRIERGAGIA